MRTLVIALSLGCLVGCGGGDSDDPQRELLRDALQRIAVLEDQLNDFNERIDSCRTAIREVNSELTDAGFHVERVPEIGQIVDRIAKEMERTQDLLKVATRNGDRLMVRGIDVADASGNTRCHVSPQGLTILDGDGRQVCSIRFDEASKVMSASLRGQRQNLVTLYAGKDRAVIGAYEGKGDQVVGWSANVTQDGQVTAGKAGQ